MGTVLTYTSYHLAQNRHLIDEIAKDLSGYKSIEELNLNELERLPFLNAVLYECLRVYPPVVLPSARVCPPPAITIEGWFIPGGVIARGKMEINTR